MQLKIESDRDSLEKAKFVLTRLAQENGMKPAGDVQRIENPEGSRKKYSYIMEAA